jgi:hypothetical protein
MMSRHALSSGYTMHTRPISTAEARELAPLILGQFSHPSAASCVGYANSANAISSVLGIRVPQNRGSVALEVGDAVLLAHLSGARLPESAQTLPEDTHLQFFVVEFEELDDLAEEHHA